jgi:hypothetical protein
MEVIVKNTKHRYPDLEKLKNRLEGQVRTLESQLQDAQKQLSSVMVTLSLLKGQEPFSMALFPTSTVSANELRGLTMLQALTKIARANNNRFKLITAKDLLVRSGVTKSPKNAANIIFTVIKRSGMFKKVGRGEYALVPEDNGSMIPPDPDDQEQPIQ